MKMPIDHQAKETARRHGAPLAQPRSPDEMDYDEMSEPNMKLSRALLIVLVLHIVAVAGIIAFNTIKTREEAIPASQHADLRAGGLHLAPA